MKKVLYVILHTQNQADRYNNIVSTWGRNVDYVFISDHEDIKNNIVKASENSTYESCEEKQVGYLNTLSLLPLKYDFYFFCSNDNFVNTKKMDEFIQSCETHCVWGELDNCWPEDKSLNFTLGGSGILISKDVISQIHGTMEWGNGRHPSWFPSDVSMAINFKKKNIEMKNSELFHHQSFEDWWNLHKQQEKIEYLEIKNHISFHNIIDFETMNLYNQSCNLL